MVAEGETVNLDSLETSFVIQHKAQTLPDLRATLRIVDDGMVNLKWTWATQTEDLTVPYEVPSNLVDTRTRITEGPKLSQYLDVQYDPFQVYFRTGSGSAPYYQVTGLALTPNAINRIHSQLGTPTGNSFTGMFGLGERTSKDFFF